YSGGEYAMKVLNDQFAGGWAVAVGPYVGNSCLDVDARLLQGDPGTVYLHCRRTPTAGGYRLGVQPSTGTFFIDRLEGDSSTYLVPQRSSSQISSDTNHIELT